MRFTGKTCLGNAILVRLVAFGIDKRMVSLRLPSFLYLYEILLKMRPDCIPYSTRFFGVCQLLEFVRNKKVIINLFFAFYFARFCSPFDWTE